MTRLTRHKRPAVDPADAGTVARDGALRRRPRILVAGEFSAGKTRLISGLLGRPVLPSNVTATALPPVWLIAGDEARQVVDLDGAVRDVDGFEGIAVEDTQFCLLATPAPFLERVDIIDTPGNSDPDSPPESWERMLQYADAVIWCTNATQAWRQSEKSVWDEMPDHLRQNATLLVTHADRLPDDRAAQRVLRRVKREAGAYFSSILIASLLHPEDITRIAEHLDAVAEGLGALPGEDNGIVRAFAASDRRPARNASATASIRPRRIGKPAAAAGPRSGELSDADTEAVVPARPEVFHLTRPITDRDAATKARAPEKSPARVIWEDLTRTTDMSDAAGVLTCVEALLDALERPQDIFTAPPFGDTGGDDIDLAVIQSAMRRRPS